MQGLLSKKDKHQGIALALNGDLLALGSAKADFSRIPGSLRRSQQKLAASRRRLSKCAPGSDSWVKAVSRAGAAAVRAARRRERFQRRAARALCRRFARITLCPSCGRIAGTDGCGAYEGFLKVLCETARRSGTDLEILALNPQSQSHRP